ncbi:hypothetical protein R4K54_13875 [Brachyspira murdochii]|uniref:Uncharacterized protein n=2 Tax=Brachyspira murdochii TaxID=84378 RepID=D5UBD5_BRAM5|nr:hypothetical protein [Brachyspira murdochii]ADG72008.1 conserved hypothetical protein [Brachyspira murdochii DSM 12563]PPS22290.1 hypothetical protein DJ52_05780 [Brachyspira murdochii]
MKITLDMSISKLLDAFDREFGVSLGIYKGAHKSDNIKLFEISDPRKSQKAFIVINKDTSVESAEAMFRNTFGIRVQIKDRNGNTVSQESTLGGIRKLDKGYVDDENKNNLLEDDDASSNEIQEENGKKKKRKKAYFLKPKTVKHTVEDKIKEIDKYYLNFQRSERYKYMLNLLSCIEEAKLAYPDSKELTDHIEDIKSKSLNISNLSIKKRRFAILVLIIVTGVLSAVGVGIWGYNLYQKVKKDKEADIIIKEIDNLRMRKGSLMESGNISEANAIDESINSKSERLNSIQNASSVSVANYFLIIAFFMAVIVAMFILRLNKYNVTSIRFGKNT